MQPLREQENIPLPSGWLDLSETARAQTLVDQADAYLESDIRPYAPEAWIVTMSLPVWPVLRMDSSVRVGGATAWVVAVAVDDPVARIRQSTSGASGACSALILR
jgi:hypothetical protein